MTKPIQDPGPFGRDLPGDKALNEIPKSLWRSLTKVSCDLIPVRDIRTPRVFLSRGIF